MPSYRTLLVLALAAFTVTPVLAAEAATQPLKNNEGRALSQLELVERDAVPPAVPKKKKGFKLGWKMKTVIGAFVAVNGLYAWALYSNHEAKKAAEKNNQTDSATPTSSAAPSPSSAGNTSSLQQNYGYPSPSSAGNTSTSLQNYGYPPPETNGDQTTGPIQQTYENPSTGPNQQTSTGQSTNPPSTNNGRREERPLRRMLGRRSPVDIPKARSFLDDIRRRSSHLDLLNRADLGDALGLLSRMLDKLD